MLLQSFVAFDTTLRTVAQAAHGRLNSPRVFPVENNLGMSSSSITTPTLSIDSPAMRSAGRDLLSLALMDARNHSLGLLLLLEQSTHNQSALQPHLPIQKHWWMAGHIAWFAEYWVGRNTRRIAGFACPSDATRLASIEPQADRWWNPALAPSSGAQPSDLPPPDAVRAYMLETLESTLELLEKTAEHNAALYFYRLALFHEDLRGEQFVVQAQRMGLSPQLAAPAGMRPREALLLPATHWQLGSRAEDGFCPDNQLSTHEVAVPEFEIDANPVSWQQYLEFVDDGGYERAELWQSAGWAWLQSAGEQGQARRGPRYVQQISMASGAVLQTRFGKPTRMAGNQAVMHVSWWEADAWCRWAGRRLPLELEWEVAAHQAARRGFAWGDVWEWCANNFYAYPGFVPGPWADASQPHFGHTRVLRGASFATRQRMKLPKLRGYAKPAWDAGFVGFRSCTL